MMKFRVWLPSFTDLRPDRGKAKRIISVGSGQLIIDLQRSSQLNNQSRATVFRHRASAECLICKGLNAYAHNKSDASCRSHCNSLSGYSITYGMLLDSVLGNSFILARRQFTSHSIDGDDFEARLMGEEANNASYREGMFTSGTQYDYGVAHEGDMGNNIETQSDKWEDDYIELGDENPKDDKKAEGNMQSSYAASDSDSDLDMNVASDEEFQAEQTDEELDELLANTPLFEPPELEEERASEPGLSFRPDGRVYFPGMEYDPEELDVSRPLPPRGRREQREKLAVSVQEVIDQADFRNVRFLTKFIGETGNILARKEFKMRAKSHRRITKAIKTARFFGLMPYTNMGRPRYVFNEPYDSDADFYESDDNFNEEGNMTQNMPDRPERGRFSGIGAFEGNRMARGRDGRRSVYTKVG